MIKSGYCVKCEKVVKIEKEKLNHILHLILTFLSGGIWSLIWGRLAYKNLWRCSYCGSKEIR